MITVIGITAFCYIHSFNHIMKMYKESNGELTFSDLIKNTINLTSKSSEVHTRMQE